jgi:hypothetical protein
LVRIGTACQQKLHKLFKDWEKAESFRKETGQGMGGRRIKDAEATGDAGALETAVWDVEGM